MTAGELLVMPDDRTQLYELVRGQLITKPLYGMAHGEMCAHIAMGLGNHVKQHGLGVTVAADTGFILERDPDTVRAPHSAFVRSGRWFHTHEYFPGAPDLAIEFEEPGVSAKIPEYFGAGARMVIVICPETQTVTMHTPTNITHLTIDDILSGGDVVPGWSLPLRELFS